MSGPVRTFLRLAGGDDSAAADPASREGHEGWVELDSWTLAAPASAADEPRLLIVGKPVDGSSPGLAADLLAGRPRPEMALEIWRPLVGSERSGRPPVADLLELPRAEAVRRYAERRRRSRRRERLDYSLRLRDVRVAAIDSEAPDPAAPGLQLETVTLACGEIRWSRGEESFTAGYLPPRPLAPLPAPGQEILEHNRDGIEVEVEVDSGGRVAGDVEVKRGRKQKAIRKWVGRWRFSPARRNGEPAPGSWSGVLDPADL